MLHIPHTQKRYKTNNRSRNQKKKTIHTWLISQMDFVNDHVTKPLLSGKNLVRNQQNVEKRTHTVQSESQKPDQPGQVGSPSDGSYGSTL